MSKRGNRRIRLKKFKEVLRSVRRKACGRAISAEADKLGIPRCPDCNSSLLCWLADSTGDYHWCLNCEAVIPIGFGDEM